MMQEEVRGDDLGIQMRHRLEYIACDAFAFPAQCGKASARLRAHDILPVHDQRRDSRPVRAPSAAPRPAGNARRRSRDRPAAAAPPAAAAVPP